MKELESLHVRRARGARVNIVDEGGLPFDGIAAVKRFTERLKEFGWQLLGEVHRHLSHHDFAENAL